MNDPRQVVNGGVRTAEAEGGEVRHPSTPMIVGFEGMFTPATSDIYTMMMFRATRASLLLLALVSVGLQACSSGSVSDATPTAPTPGPATTVTPPAVKPALAAPVPTSPSSGATVAARPSFIVQNAARTGTVSGTVSYTFEIADNSAFSPLTTSDSVPEGVEQTTMTLTSDLIAGRTYFWRAVAGATADGITSPPSDTQTLTIVSLTQAGQIAQQQGVVLWPGAQPTGTAGQARLGPGWSIGARTSFNGVTFQSPPIDALRVFDLLDRGFDPDAAVGWMRVNGYGSVPVYYSSVQAIGFPYQYMALVNGAWELVHRVGA